MGTRLMVADTKQLSGLALALAMAIVPLAVDGLQAEPFQSAKASWLSLFGILALISGSLAVGHDRVLRARLVKNPLFWPALFFFAALTISTVFSVNPRLSFFSDHYRSHGWIAWLCYLGLFVAAVVSSHASRQWFYYSLELATTLTSLWILAQGVGLTRFLMEEGAARPPGPLGSPATSAEWLVLALFVSLTAPISRPRWASFALATVTVAAIIVSGSRAVVLGLGFGGLFLLCGWLTTKQHRKISLGILLLVLVIIIILFVISNSYSIVDDNDSLFNRLLQAFNPLTWTARLRLSLWRDSFEMIMAQGTTGLERVLFGYGPETLKLVYGPFMNDVMSWANHDRHPFAAPYYAHNQMLDIWRDTGLVGLLSFTACFSLALWKALRSIGCHCPRLWVGLVAIGTIGGATAAIGLLGIGAMWTGICLGLALATTLYVSLQASQPKSIAAMGSVAGLLGFSIGLQFSFLTPATGALLWVCLGLVASKSPDTSDSSEAPGSLLWLKLPVGLVLVAGLAANSRPAYEATHVFVDGLLSQDGLLLLLILLGAIWLWRKRERLWLAVIAIALFFNLVYVAALNRTISGLLSGSDSGVLSLLLGLQVSVVIGVVLVAGYGAMRRMDLRFPTSRTGIMVAVPVLLLSVWLVRDAQAKRLFGQALDMDQTFPPATQKSIMAEAIYMTPFRPLWYYYAATQSAQVADYEQAVSWLNIARSLEPQNPLYLAELSAIRIQEMQQADNAATRATLIAEIKQHYQDLARLAPLLPATWTEWARFLLAVPDTLRAYEMALHGVSLGRDHYRPAWITLGDAAVSLAGILPDRSNILLAEAEAAYLHALEWGPSPMLDKRLSRLRALIHNATMTN